MRTADAQQWLSLGLVAIRLLRSPVHRLLVLAAGATAVLAIGASRLYLGVHWLTDVPGRLAAPSERLLDKVSEVTLRFWAPWR